MSFLDDFANPRVGANRLKLSLNRTTLVPRAGSSVIVDVDYGDADVDGGVILPLGQIVQAPTVAGYRTHIYRNLFPKQLVCQLLTAGEHVITLKELGHNLFFGSIRFTAIGDKLYPALVRRT